MLETRPICWSNLSLGLLDNVTDTGKDTATQGLYYGGIGMKQLFDLKISDLLVYKGEVKMDVTTWLVHPLLFTSLVRFEGFHGESSNFVLGLG